MVALSIFDPRRVPCVDSDDLFCYGEDSVNTLLAHYGIDRSAETLESNRFFYCFFTIKTVKEAIISSDSRTEWKTFPLVHV